MDAAEMEGNGYAAPEGIDECTGDHQSGCYGETHYPPHGPECRILAKPEHHAGPEEGAVPEANIECLLQPVLLEVSPDILEVESLPFPKEFDAPAAIEDPRDGEHAKCANDRGDKQRGARVDDPLLRQRRVEADAKKRTQNNA